MAYISSISLSQYGTTARPSGHITIADKGISTTIQLIEEDAANLQATAIAIFEHRRQSFAQAILDIDAQPPMLAGPGKVIDDEIPF